MNYFQRAPGVIQSMVAFKEATNTLSLPTAIRQVVKMRVSQINGNPGIDVRAHPRKRISQHALADGHS